jgi:hypothetical protein
MLKSQRDGRKWSALQTLAPGSAWDVRIARKWFIFLVTHACMLKMVQDADCACMCHLS